LKYYTSKKKPERDGGVAKCNNINVVAMAEAQPKQKRLPLKQM
jgi:hypothetical protein